MNKFSNIMILILSIAVLVMFFIMITNEPEKVYIKKVDTLTVNIIIPGEKIYIKVPGKMRLRKSIDTLYLKQDTIYYSTPAFVSILDTIVPDTIKVKYKFPENIFSLKINPVSDTTIYQYVTIEKEVMKKGDWYEAPAYILGGLIVGYFINDLKK